MTRISLVLDNLSVHKGKRVQTWMAPHPCSFCHFLPMHCSWMNQVGQWFGILQRKRLRISDFTNLKQLAERLLAFVAEWTTHAHPFNWSAKSEALVMATYEARTQMAFAA